MMMQCGHVLARDSLVRLARGKNAGMSSTTVTTVNNPNNNNNPNHGGNTVTSGTPINTPASTTSSSGGTTMLVRVDPWADIPGIQLQAKVKCPYCPVESTLSQAMLISF